VALKGVQTHIEAWTNPTELAFVAAHGYQLARIAAMECSDAVLAECVRDTEAAGLRPFITIADPERMRLFPGRDYECRNEDDGDISAPTYRRILDDMATVAVETGSRLWGPTCSNTNRKCVRWATAVRGSGWPVGMHGLSWHSYDPHENTEFAAVEALADGMPILFSEFGYPSLGISEDEQAAKIRELWTVYEKYYGAILFQLHDGPNPQEREHCYGIQRVDGTWKPSAFVVPNPGTIVPNLGTSESTTDQENAMADTGIVIYRKALIPLEGRPGKYSAYAKPDDQTLIVAVDEHGNVYANPVENIGRAYETFEIDASGDLALFVESGPLARPIRIVD
jgi:hypothetical protein